MLTGVTITGADDEVDPSALAALQEEFPFVEWGVLLSASRAGTPRYPSYDSVCRFDRYRPGHLRLSGHLCGAQAREILEGREPSFIALEFLPRIQINGYTARSIAAVAFARSMPSSEIILQVRDESWLQEAARDAEQVRSMEPLVADGALVVVEPTFSHAALLVGDVVLCRVGHNEFLHLIKAIRSDTGTRLFKIGNNKGRTNGWVPKENIYGRCVSVDSVTVFPAGGT